MKIKLTDYAFITFVGIILAVILNVFLSGCSPIQILESEKIAEEVVEDVVKEELKGKQ